MTRDAHKNLEALPRRVQSAERDSMGDSARIVDGQCQAEGVVEPAESETDPIMARAASMLPVKLLQSGEIVILLLKPSPLYILLVPLQTVMMIVLGTLLAVLTNRAFEVGMSSRQILLVGLTLLAIRLGWQFLDWLSRVYVLTDRRIMTIQGVLTVQIFEAPLNQIQHTDLIRTVRERLFGLGSISFATAGTALRETAWLMLANPLDVHRQIVAAISRYRH